MCKRKLFPIFFIFAWLLTGCALPPPQDSYPDHGFSPESPDSMQLRDCYELTATDIVPILNEPIALTPTIDGENCIYVSDETLTATVATGGLLPASGPIAQRHYVAIQLVSVNGRGNPLYLIADDLFNMDSDRAFAFAHQSIRTLGLQQLATVDIAWPTLTRQFLPDAGDGALWLWQSTATDHHLATLHQVVGEYWVSVQAFVAPEHSEEEMQRQMRILATTVLERHPDASYPRIPESFPVQLNEPFTLRNEQAADVSEMPVEYRRIRATVKDDKRCGFCAVDQGATIALSFHEGDNITRKKYEVKAYAGLGPYAKITHEGYEVELLAFGPTSHLVDGQTPHTIKAEDYRIQLIVRQLAAASN